MPSKGRRQSITSKENGVVSFNSKDNANTLVRFSQTQRIHCCRNFHVKKIKSGVKTTEEYYKQIRKECQDFVLQNVNVTNVHQILKNLDVATTSGIDQIFAKSFKDGAPVIAILLCQNNKND